MKVSLFKEFKNIVTKGEKGEIMMSSFSFCHNDFKIVCSRCDEIWEKVKEI